MARVTEFDVYRLDALGYPIDVATYTEMPKALEYARKHAPKFAAVVVERRHMESNVFGDAVETVDTEVVWHAGSEEALIAWGG
ncbi:MAG: hypothetical protein ACO32I_09135 [Candidatus Limnocylindrus sp.]